MSALSAKYSHELPYVHTYKGGKIHRAYWLIGAEADHILPVSRGGNGTDLANHATACVLCNTRKAERTLKELDWTLTPTGERSWDGCVPMYRDLWQHVGQPKPDHHEKWIHAFEQADAGRMLG